MFWISEKSPQQFFSARRTSLWESAFFFFMTTWDKWRESFRAVHALLWLLDLLLACMPVSRLEMKQKIERKKNLFSFQFQSVTSYAFSKMFSHLLFQSAVFILTSCAVLPEEFFWAGLAPCSRSPPTSNLSSWDQAQLRGHIISIIYIYTSIAMAGLNRFEVAKKRDLLLFVPAIASHASSFFGSFATSGPAVWPIAQVQTILASPVSAALCNG